LHASQYRADGYFDGSAASHRIATAIKRKPQIQRPAPINRHVAFLSSLRVGENHVFFFSFLSFQNKNNVELPSFSSTCSSSSSSFIKLLACQPPLITESFCDVRPITSLGPLATARLASVPRNQLTRNFSCSWFEKKGKGEACRPTSKIEAFCQPLFYFAFSCFFYKAKHGGEKKN